MLGRFSGPFNFQRSVFVLVVSGVIDGSSDDVINGILWFFCKGLPTKRKLDFTINARHVFCITNLFICIHKRIGIVSICGNGKDCAFPDNASVLDAIRFLKPGSEFVAAELNDKILEKSSFESIKLKNGDVLEIIQPLGGGFR